MSQDAKNSILLWAGTLVVFGLFWAVLYFDVGIDIPDRWVWPLFGLAVGLNVVKSVRDHFRMRKAKARQPPQGAG